jgi:hypothetical protein
MQRTLPKSGQIHNAVSDIPFAKQCDHGIRWYSTGAEWARNPIGVWRSDGSLYKTRTVQPPKSSWGLRGPLLALAVGGVALWYAPASTVELQRGFTTLSNTLRQALSLQKAQKKPDETSRVIPDAQPTTSSVPPFNAVLCCSCDAHCTNLSDFL